MYLEEKHLTRFMYAHEVPLIRKLMPVQRGFARELRRPGERDRQPATLGEIFNKHPRGTDLLNFSKSLKLLHPNNAYCQGTVPAISR